MLVSRWSKLSSSRPKAASVHQISRILTLPSTCRPYHSTPLLLRHEKQRPSIESLYVDTVAPSPAQSAASKIFFRTHLPSKSWTATEWRTTDVNTPTLTPEVAFLGRSNSGKSSLLNAVLLDPGLCRVGPKPGKTTTMHAWSLAPIDEKTRGARRGYQGDTEPKLTVLDMPGYGHGSHGDWGNDIMKYLTTRRQFRRAFVLVNPVHGLKRADLYMLELLRKHGVPHQLVACKCDHDSIKELPNLLKRIQSTIKAHFDTHGRNLPVLLTINDIIAVAGLGDGRANQRVKEEDMYGVDDVRWAVIRAAGLEEYVMALRANGELLPRKKVAGNVQSIANDEAEERRPKVNGLQEERPTLYSTPDMGTMNAEAELVAATPQNESAPVFTSNPLADLNEVVSAEENKQGSESAPPTTDIGMSIEDFLGDLVPTPSKPNPPASVSKPPLSAPSIGVGIDALMSMTASPRRQKNSNTGDVTNFDKSKNGMRQRGQDTKERARGLAKNARWSQDRTSNKPRLHRR